MHIVHASKNANWKAKWKRNTYNELRTSLSVPTYDFIVGLSIGDKSFEKSQSFKTRWHLQYFQIMNLFNNCKQSIYKWKQAFSLKKI